MPGVAKAGNERQKVHGVHSVPRIETRVPFLDSHSRGSECQAEALELFPGASAFSFARFRRPQRIKQWRKQGVLWNHGQGLLFAEQDMNEMGIFGTPWRATRLQV